MTLREALKHIDFELDVWAGKPSITTATKPKKPDLAAMRSEADRFFKRHAQEEDDG